MLKMKKLLALMLALIMALSLFACGGNTNQPQETQNVVSGGENPTEEEFDDWPLTIKVWVCNTGNGYEYLQSCAREFNASQDH